MKKIPIFYDSSETVSHQELKRLFAIAKEHGKTPDDVKRIAQALGYKSRKQIRRFDIPTIENKLKAKKK